MTKHSLATLDGIIKMTEPATFWELVKLVKENTPNEVALVFEIVRYMGRCQGVKIILKWIENRKVKTATLPGKGLVYACSE